MRDTLSFLMYDWLEVEALTRRPRYADHSRETFDSVLETSERIAREKFAPANRRADAEEPAFDGERVRVPESTRDAVAAYRESGLLAAGHDYELGGMQLPYVVDMAANTFFAMASIGLAAFAMLTYANANLLMAHGSGRQRRAFGQPLLDGRWLGTMCLSEPQAGSSLGDIRTRAVADGPGAEADPLGPRYRLTGNKMWISGGEHDLSENIVHLVLAKIPDESGKLPPGPKGISLFIVPRVMVDAEGRLTGRRNDVALAGLNHKLGYRGIPNTLLNFGEGRFPVAADGTAEAVRPGAVGYLVGAAGTGLASMFHMMNEARINVGMGAAMLGCAGYLASLDYARNRPQGRVDGSGKGADGPQVRIVEHADVRRMLLAQKAYAEGALALALLCARLVDEKRTGSSDEAHVAGCLLELLTPIAKSWPSEWCLEANSLAIQVHGGYGYTRDFPVEQYWRDNRLNMIHEGTHGIQANDLLGRKVRAGDGRGMALLLSRVAQTTARCRSHPALAAPARALSDAFAALNRAAAAAWADGDRRKALANSMPFLQAFGHSVLAWVWLDVAVAAQAALLAGAPRGESFYRGKLQAAHYFFRHELPRVHPWIAVVDACDTTSLDMQDAWF
ncbi:MAG: acyl-CoA dehydrogenase [Burkholderiales bacterium]|nr:acyl-CoA dehydrogenase [Burkholderiales bacterium]